MITGGVLQYELEHLKGSFIWLKRGLEAWDYTKIKYLCCPIASKPPSNCYSLLTMSTSSVFRPDTIADVPSNPFSSSRTQELVPIDPKHYNEMVSCVYPISGQYGLLPRLLYYVSLYFAVVARRQPWLVAGALCSAMIYSSTAVLHIFVMLFSQGTDPAVVDSDMIPLNLLLLIGAMFPGPVVDFSSTVRDSAARPIILIWGLWMMVGTITAMSGLGNVVLGNSFTPTAENQQELPFAPLTSFDSPNLYFRHKSSQILCRATNSTTVLESAAQLNTPGLHFNCTYSCFNARTSPIRGTGEIQIIPFTTLHGCKFTTLWCIGFIALALALVQTLVQYTRSWIIPTLHTYVMDATWGLVTSRIGSGNPSKRTHGVSELFSIWFATLLRFLNLILAVPLIVMGEMYILGVGGEQRIPAAEGVKTIGQWGAPVGAGFLVTAAVFSRWLERRSALKDAETGIPEMMSRAEEGI